MMTKDINKNNNLFKWATKELSQDAVLAWLLNKKKIGEELLKSMCTSLRNKYFKIENVSTQIQNIDILIDLKIGDKYVAIIIEDKTDTYLHDHQMLKCIKKIERRKVKKKNYSEIIYVLFKTGKVYSFEEMDFNVRKDEINNGKRKFEKQDLNDALPNSLIISGTNQAKEIDLKMQSITVEDIYTLNDFKKFVRELNIDDPVFKHFRDYIRNENISNCKVDNENFEKASNASKEAKKTVGEEVKLRMIRPGGGGKRNYEFCFHSEAFYSYGKEAENIEKISDNFLILPYIRKKDKGYCYAINYNLIGDINKLHGYIPYNQLPKNAKKKLPNFKKEVKNIATNIINSEGISSTVYLNDSIKDNRLQVLSFNSETIDENKINLLLKLAKKLSDGIKNS